MVHSTWGMVWSRIRFDWRRHFAAASAVAILMASFLSFNAVAGGIDAALDEELSSGGHDRLQLSSGRFVGPNSTQSNLDVDRIASWDGVESASPRSAKATGIKGPSGGPGGTVGFPGGAANLSSELVLVGIRASTEASLVVRAAPAAPGNIVFGGDIVRGRTASNFSLLSGSWIQARGQAVATQMAADAGFGIGKTFTVNETTYTVVGVIGNFHPAANLNVAGVFPAGQLLIDRDGQEWPTTGGAYVELRSDYPTIQTVTRRIIEEYPAYALGLEGGLADLERQFYEASRTQQVLSAAGRLVGVAGAATLFAMSLFLLIGERKAFGAMASVGFSRSRIGSYMGQKILHVALWGAISGGILGAFVVQGIDVPTVSFASTPTIDLAAYGLATAQTLAAALLGSLAAFLLTIRQDPVQALAAD
jgi:MacB-like protein